MPVRAQCSLPISRTSLQITPMCVSMCQLLHVLGASILGDRGLAPAVINHVLAGAGRLDALVAPRGVCRSTSVTTTMRTPKTPGAKSKGLARQRSHGPARLPVHTESNPCTDDVLKPASRGEGDRPGLTMGLPSRPSPGRRLSFWNWVVRRETNRCQNKRRHSRRSHRHRRRDWASAPRR